MGIYQILRSPPAIDSLAVSVLEPPEALPEGPFDLPLNRVDLVACNPLLPLEFWVIHAPTHEPTRGALALLQLHLSGFLLPVVAVVVHRGWRRRGSIRCAVAPQVIAMGRPRSWAASVAKGFNLHAVPAITVAGGSWPAVVPHGWEIGGGRGVTRETGCLLGIFVFVFVFDPICCGWAGDSWRNLGCFMNLVRYWGDLCNHSFIFLWSWGNESCLRKGERRQLEGAKKVSTFWLCGWGGASLVSLVLNSHTN